MNTMFLAAQDAAQGGGNYSFLIMMVLIFAIMWLFMIRPQQKKQKEIKKFQNSLVAGAKVVTAGGVYGTVRSVDLEKGIIYVEIAKGVVVGVDKNCVYADATDSQAANAK